MRLVGRDGEGWEMSDILRWGWHMGDYQRTVGQGRESGCISSPDPILILILQQKS